MRTHSCKCSRETENEHLQVTVEYWRRSGFIPPKPIRSTDVNATTNVHTKQ